MFGQKIWYNRICCILDAVITRMESRATTGEWGDEGTVEREDAGC